MAAGNPISGAEGTVMTGEAPVALVHITNWKVKTKANTDRFADNSSGGYKRSVAGSKEWDGSFDGKVNDGESVPLSEGDNTDAAFHIDGDGGGYYSGTITVTGVDVETDIDSGKVVSYTVSFEGDGELTKSGHLGSSGGE